MDPTEATHWRERLQAAREQLEAVAESGRDASSTVQLDQTRVGRLSRMDALQGQAMSQEGERRRKARLVRIDAAVRRLDDGSFGDCLACEEPIDRRRLAVDPAATHCIACAESATSR